MNLSIDKAVLHVFRTHPLSFAIHWDYFLSGVNNEATTAEVLYGPTKGLNQHVTKRFRHLDGVDTQFWKLYQRWLAPSEKQISNWRKDLCRQYLSIFNTFKRDSTVDRDNSLFQRGDQDIVAAMMEEFPKENQIIQREFESGGFPLALAYYEQLLETHQSARVIVLGHQNAEHNVMENPVFAVIHVCVRLITNICSTEKRKSSPNTSLIDHAVSGTKGITTLQLQNWVYIGSPVLTDYIEDDIDLNSANIWAERNMQYISQNVHQEAKPMRARIQKLFQYSFIDAPNGLLRSIFEMNEQLKRSEWNKTQPEYGQLERLYTKARSTQANVPWRLKNSQWEDGRISRINYDALMAILGEIRMPEYPELIRPRQETSGETMAVEPTGKRQRYNPIGPSDEESTILSLNNLGLVIVLGALAFYAYA